MPQKNEDRVSKSLSKATRISPTRRPSWMERERDIQNPRPLGFSPLTEEERMIGNREVNRKRTTSRSPSKKGSR